MSKRLIAALVIASMSLWSVPEICAALSIPQPAEHVRDHSCCHRVRALTQFFVTPAPAGMPCGDQHPCCARQRPADPASLPDARRNSQCDAQYGCATIAGVNPLERSDSASATDGRDPFQLYSRQSTILRN